MSVQKEMEKQTEMENLVLATALELVDKESCFVGIGVPSLAAMLAKRTHAPNLVLIYESGAIDANPPIPPLSTGSPSVTADTAMIGDCLDVFGDLQAGRIDVGLLSAAQVDRHGNLNSTVIGDYRHPKLRMVGSGGAHDIASMANRVVIVMPHDPRRFVAAVDFITSPGFLNGGGERTRCGLRGGPRAVITGRGRFVFENEELHLEHSFHPFSLAQAVEGFGWQVPICPGAHCFNGFDEHARQVARDIGFNAGA
jgi:glutaconate CoA-transferase subunit B